MAHKMRFTLNISAELYGVYYQGNARFVQVKAEDGRTLRFPASELQRFVSHTGVQGNFEIEFSEDYKLVSLRRLT